ncbi:MAG: hypothetical protein AAGC63_11540 [Propionicimonas sp.]
MTGLATVVDHLALTGAHVTNCSVNDRVCFDVPKGATVAWTSATGNTVDMAAGVPETFEALPAADLGPDDGDRLLRMVHTVRAALGKPRPALRIALWAKGEGRVLATVVAF